MFNVESILPTTSDTLLKLIKYKNGSDALTLHLLYIELNKRWQLSDPNSNDVLVESILSRPMSRIHEAKKTLAAAWLIYSEIEKDPDWNIVARHFKIYVLTEDVETVQIKPPTSKKKKWIDTLYSWEEDIKNIIKSILSEKEIEDNANALFVLLPLYSAGLMIWDKKRILYQCQSIKTLYDSIWYKTDNWSEFEKIANKCAQYNLWLMESWKKKREDINFLSSFNTFVSKNVKDWKN